MSAIVTLLQALWSHPPFSHRTP